MLIFEKVQEIQTILNTLNQKQQNFESEQLETLEKKFQALTQLLTSNIQNSSEQNLAQITQSLTQQNNANAENLNNEIKKQISNAKNLLNTELKAQITQDAQASALQIKKAIQVKLKDELSEAVDNQLENLSQNIAKDKIFREQIKAKLQTQVENATKNIIDNLNLNDFIDFGRIKVDYSILTQNIADEFINSNAMQETIEAVKRNTSKAIGAYIDSDEALAQAINEIGMRDAQTIFEQALNKDELIKMRLETMQYLQALRVSGLEKSIIDIASDILEKHSREKRREVFDDILDGKYRKMNVYLGI